jgi:anaerobic selenocysteine-containing dehydrogenase
MLTGYKQVASLRAINPEPILEMHPETARTMSLRDGSWIYIETRRGKVKQRLAFNPDIDPRVIVSSFGWWFPEEKGIFGWDKSNINVLTNSEPPYDPGVGTSDLRGVPCRVFAA